MSNVLSVTLKSPTERSFVGHNVNALFVQLVVKEGEGKESLKIPGEVSAPVSSQGNVTLEFPPELDCDTRIQIRVLAPDGQMLKQEGVDPGLVKSGKTVEIEVDPKEYFPIEKNTDQAFGKPTRFRGFIIDSTGKGRVGDRQVVNRDDLQCRTMHHWQSLSWHVPIRVVIFPRTIH